MRTDYLDGTSSTLAETPEGTEIWDRRPTPFSPGNDNMVQPALNYTTEMPQKRHFNMSCSIANTNHFLLDYPSFFHKHAASFRQLNFRGGLGNDYADDGSNGK